MTEFNNKKVNLGIEGETPKKIIQYNKFDPIRQNQDPDNNLPTFSPTRGDGIYIRIIFKIK